MKFLGNIIWLICGGLLKEMERKIDKLKDEMALIIKKIDAIDENLE